MPNNSSGDSPNTRSAGGARPTTVAVAQSLTPGFYWARWLNAAHGTADNGEPCMGADADWEVVEVWENSLDSSDDEHLLVHVVGVEKAQGLHRFEWGERVSREVPAEPVRHGVDVVLESGNTEIDELCGHDRTVQGERCPDCLEVVYEVPSPPDSSVSREATGRLGDDPSGQFARYQQEIDRLVCEVPVPVSMASPELFIAHIRSILHSGHRYSTVGDWQFQQAAVDCVHIAVQVSATADWRHAALIAIHELIEAILCRHRGISQDEVDSFDLSHPELVEPGASDNAPYHDEHMIAEFIERQLAGLLNVDWHDYTAALDALDD